MDTEGDLVQGANITAAGAEMEVDGGGEEEKEKEGANKGEEGKAKGGDGEGKGRGKRVTCSYSECEFCKKWGSHKPANCWDNPKNKQSKGKKKGNK
jgi:hypothetical protein